MNVKILHKKKNATEEFYESKIINNYGQRIMSFRALESLRLIEITEEDFIDILKFAKLENFGQTEDVIFTQNELPTPQEFLDYINK